MHTTRPPDRPEPATPDLRRWAEATVADLDRAGLLRTSRRFWPVLATHLVSGAVVAALLGLLVATGHDALEVAAYAWPLIFAAQAVAETVALWPPRRTR